MKKKNFWGIGQDVAPKAKVTVKFLEDGKAQIISSADKKERTYNLVLVSDSVADELEKISDHRLSKTTT